MRRVLVVDDHTPSRAHLVTTLKERGYELVGEATTGKLALVMARAARPEIILMAVGLPDMDGIEAAREVMQLQPLPIILLTSHCDAATVERAKQAGVMGYLVKPLRAAELTPTVELAIKRFNDCNALRAENSSLKESLQARKLIERAKGLLMSQRNLSEEQAYTLLKKTSMNVRKPMADIAQAIILAGGLFNFEKG
jgi:AmiR/NasT family two-component response regulator